MAASTVEQQPRRRERREKRGRERTTAPASPTMPGDFTVVAPKQQSRLPQIALGLLIVAAFGLASLWWFTQATEKDEVLSLAVPVERGEVVEFENLVVVAISSDDALATIPRSGAGEIVGRVSLSDLPAGAILTPSMFAAADVLEVGEGVVGLELEAGEIPAIRLVPGDTVSVIMTPRSGATEELRDGGALEASEVLVDGAVVVESTPIGVQGRQYVALAMTEKEAQVVSVAAAADRIRLVRVARAN